MCYAGTCHSSCNRDRDCFGFERCDAGVCLVPGGGDESDADGGAPGEPPSSADGGSDSGAFADLGPPADSSLPADPGPDGDRAAADPTICRFAYRDADLDGYVVGQRQSVCSAGPLPVGWLEQPVDSGPTAAQVPGAVTSRTNGAAPLAWAIKQGDLAALDGSMVTASASAGAFPLVTDYLVASDFRFNLPAGSIIFGIEVTAYRATTCGGATDAAVRLVRGGVIEPQAAAVGTGTAWPTDVVGPLPPVTYGSGTELWGRTWSAAQINATGFGFAIAAGVTGADAGCQLSVDQVRIVVYYNHDCYDGNAAAKPGQLAYFSSARGDASFDYDCSGAEEREPLAETACVCTDGSCAPGARSAPLSACGARASVAQCSGGTCATPGAFCAGSQAMLAVTCR